MDTDEIGVAIVGHGAMGLTHLAAWSFVENCRVEAVVGRDPGKRRKVEKAFKVKAYTDLNQVLENDEIDVVDICTPTHTHAAQAIMAMKAGKDVLLEKPMSLTLGEADDMITAAKENKAKLMVAQVVRFFPEYMKAKQMVDAGMVGEPVIGRAYRAAPLPIRGRWATDKKKSGGVILDLSIHDIDFMLWCYSDAVESVYAKLQTSINRGRTTADLALINLKFSGGGIALVEGSWAHPRAFPFTTRLELSGTRGTIAFDGQSSVPVKIIDDESTATFSPEALRGQAASLPFAVDPFYREIRHFVDCIREDRVPMTSGEEARKGLEVALAAMRSAATNEVVELPLEEA